MYTKILQAIEEFRTFSIAKRGTGRFEIWEELCPQRLCSVVSHAMLTDVIREVLQRNEGLSMLEVPFHVLIRHRTKESSSRIVSAM